MSCFPTECRFRASWRPYQRRVLKAFDRHIADRHFHVSAAPGAGKTLLGIEALLRLGRPALVLAPTSAIRDQWLLRLRQAFLPHAAELGWVSTDLLAPAALTVSTYQALHAAERRLGARGLLDALASCGIATLVLDEAHHLRQAWWRCLERLKHGLSDPVVVALTATPPLDVPQQEWNRYIGLCGSIDAEVSIPELVLAGNLCPHQDYLYFSRPSGAESARLEQFETEVRSLLNDLVCDPELVAHIAQMPLVQQPEAALGSLSKRSDFALATLVFLQSAAAEHARGLLHTFGLSEARLPAFDRHWAELLLAGLLLDKGALRLPRDHVVQGLRARLQRIGALKLRQLNLRAPPQLMRLLESSQRKSESITRIVEFEAHADPAGLRALVLCDRIHEAEFPEPGAPRPGLAQPGLAQLGVVPVFEQLRRLQLPQLRLGILSGSVVVVPTMALPALQHALRDRAGAEIALCAEPLWHARDYLRISVAESAASALLSAVTAVFESGEVNLLVGTAALLGEGWDAPSLSTLILATSARTAMSSNQLRGRAIRVQPGYPQKTANIWHLACLHPDADTAGGPDLQRLAQRFRSFAAVSLHAAVIENGIDRLGLEHAALLALDCETLNARMCALAADRPAMARMWRSALEDRSHTPKRMLHEIRIAPRRIAASARFLHSLAFERWPVLRWWRAWRLRRRLQAVGDALLRTLWAHALIDADSGRVMVAVAGRSVRCHLADAETHDETLFAQALSEFFDLPQAPRYLLRNKDACYAVPACLGGRRAQAERLGTELQAALGRLQLIYTRKGDGRLALLRARERWLSERFNEACDTRQVWG